MKLSSLLEKLEYTCVQGSTEQEVTGVVYDSRKVTDGSLFICIRGAVVDGHKFIPDVTAKGAKVLVVEENQFASGSMLPKIEAGISFIEKGEGRSTVITDMAHAKEGYEGKTGTTIR